MKSYRNNYNLIISIVMITLAQRGGALRNPV